MSDDSAADRRPTVVTQQRQRALLEYGNKRSISLDQAKAELAKTAMTLQTQTQLNAAEHAKATAALEASRGEIPVCGNPDRHFVEGPNGVEVLFRNRINQWFSLRPANPFMQTVKDAMAADLTRLGTMVNRLTDQNGKLGAANDLLKAELSSLMAENQHLHDALALRAATAAKLSAETTPQPPAHDPFRQFPGDPRRIGA